MRDLVVLCAMFVFVPMALMSSTAAYLLWTWTALISIQDYTYGFMRGIPFNQIFALIAITGILISKDHNKGQFKPNRTTILYFFFIIQATISVIFAQHENPRTWEIYGNIIKAMVFCFFMPIVLTTRWRIHGIVVALVLGLAFHGWMEGLKTIVSAGGHRIIGILKFGDNNQLAVILLMGFPLLIYLVQYSKVASVRLGMLGALLANAAAVIGTQSRGALIAMMAVGLWLIARSRRAGLSIFIALCTVTFVVAFAPETWWDRMGTIDEAGTDSSFMGRVVAWKVSSAIALGNPISGGGFRAVQTQSMWNMYKNSDGLLGFIDTPVRPPIFVAAHSIYFEVLGDMGFIGLFIFLAILFNAFFTRKEIHKLVKKDDVERLWIRDLSDMLGAALFVYMVGGAALSLAYFEVVYIFVMLMEVLKTYAKSATEKPASIQTSALQ